jgi:5,6-dimethylbenzimidazole synthase
MRFTKEDSNILLDILKSRRDVRGNLFLSKEIEDDKLELILKSALYAPSVGYSQPWEFIVIKDKSIKNNIYKNFEKENQKAKKIFNSPLYDSLKLEGIKEAPINIAVLYNPPKKEILGMTSMQKMGEYSVVCAVENMWLMARSLNIGIGWVSILDEKYILNLLDKKDKKLIAYLCVGYVKEFYDEPELKKLKWEEEKRLNEVVSYL